MFRVLSILAPTSAAMAVSAASAAARDDSGRVAWITDGDTFRLESGERIRIAAVDAPETHRDRARCVGERVLGLSERLEGVRPDRGGSNA
jgi:endonuclease YncB( thermonuclease family)